MIYEKIPVELIVPFFIIISVFVNNVVFTIINFALDVLFILQWGMYEIVYEDRRSRQQDIY